MRLIQFIRAVSTPFQFIPSLRSVCVSTFIGSEDLLQRITEDPQFRSAFHVREANGMLFYRCVLVLVTDHYWITLRKRLADHWRLL